MRAIQGAISAVLTVRTRELCVAAPLRSCSSTKLTNIHAITVQKEPGPRNLGDLRFTVAFEFAALYYTCDPHYQRIPPGVLCGGR
ncbi:hypothetical protein IWX90DRAFT_93312 [Phyllosticta citrichinensis]|uniref:Secreted protein n=1 Tax=Phyllosticta citrichinensis TaxID=1130410 RepID=A0ABR1XEY6_9PEZI